ncbi:MAG: amidase, partial [Acidobacteriaceae bacterium]|nr:amidase [Acidobacteriaceae bacterium]
MPEKIARRAWLKAASAIAASTATAQNPQQTDVPDKITREALHQSLVVAGLEFTPEQEEMMLRGVNRNLAGYETLRKIDVPLDTEPATRFFPTAPAVVRGKFQPTRYKATQAPANLEDLAFAPVTEIAPLLKAKKVKSVDLTRMYLGRLKRYGPKLNCVITLTEELALAQAEQADSEIRHGKYRGPLHGVPCGVKDLFATKGIKTTWGAEPYANQIFDYDSTVVERLRAAGSPLLAKLSMGALAQGGLWFGGMTKTPWNLEQSSSGSSAGSAAATAAGLVGFSIGTETLGSIISPSTRCGTTGL